MHLIIAFQIQLNQNFLEISNFKKNDFIEKKQNFYLKVLVVSVGFHSILTCQVKKWSNFVAEREHPFLKYISAIEELKVMGVDTTEKYSEY